MPAAGTKPLHIAILMHARDPAEPPRQWIMVAMAEVWRAMGHEVEFVRGVEGLGEADLLVPHVDLTVLPPEYVRAFARHTHVANRAVVDISKRSFSRLRVGPEEPDAGPVIVKSNLNYGGLPERRRLGRRWRERRLVRGLMRLVVRTDPRTGFHPWLPIEPYHYPVYDSVGDVPPAVWRDPRFHVERFVPERDGELYCLRSYTFAGTAEINVRSKSPHAVVKAPDIVEREEVAVPDELREVRAALGFDYGKFDHVVVGGAVHLLDINRTPTFAPLPQYSARQKEIAALFARGLLERFGLAVPA